MNKGKAVIIGGGIGGAVTALFLKRAGFESEIYEARAEDDTTTGWFLNLAGNGLDVLHILGLDDVVESEGSPVPRMLMWSGRGKRLGEVRNGARHGLTESVIIRRGSLQRLLTDAVRAEGIPVHFQKRLKDLDLRAADHVTATFEDGSSVSGDILIGADGIHSRTRQIINPAAPRPHYTGLVSTAGFTDRLSLPPTTDTQHFIFGKRAFFGYHVRSSGEVYWFNNHKQPGAPERSDLALESDEWKRRLLDMHRDDMPLVRQIIEATESGIGAFPMYDMPSQPVWWKGRVVLLGDAVHAVSANSGQGASMAMEDAAILSKCLRDITPPEQAFAAYERLRRDRVERIVAWGRSLGEPKLITHPVKIWLRDLLMPIFLKRAANPAALDWLYAYNVEWDKRPSGAPVDERAVPTPETVA